MKLCRLIPVNADTFSHTPQHSQKAGNFPSSMGYMEALSKEWEIQKTGHTLEKNNYTSPSSNSSQKLTCQYYPDTNHVVRGPYIVM